MDTCLRDRALLLLAAGEGTHEQRAHVEICITCAIRYRRFVRDLEAIEQVLQETVPSPVVSSRLFSFRARWVPVAAALAAALALVWGSIWQQQPSQPIATRKAFSEDVSRFLANEISPVLFATNDLRIATLPEPVSNSAYLQAALEGGWPCERQEPFFYATCDFYPFPLFIEGQ
jgi:hypothetical protein